MPRGIFLAGNDSALTRAIETEAANHADQYAVSLISNRLSSGNLVSAAKNPSINTSINNDNIDNIENKERHFLDWNPSSAISARTLVLAASNRLEIINEALLVCSPPSIRCFPAELPLADIEIMINDQIKGWFYLVRELAGIFSKQKQGTLVLVYPDIAGAGKDDALDVLGPAALASFRALVHSLLSASHNDKYTTIGFSSSDAGNETAFASYIFKQLDDLKTKNGKLYKFGKFKLF